MPTLKVEGPKTNIGQIGNDFMITMRVAELRKTIKTLEARIAELEALKGATLEPGQQLNLD